MKSRSREDIPAALDAFRQLMQAKLQENTHKPHWAGLPVEILHDRLLDEAAELRSALIAGHAGNIARECADVANFALMIADVCGGLPDAPVPVGPRWDKARMLARDNPKYRLRFAQFEGVDVVDEEDHTAHTARPFHVKLGDDLSEAIAAASIRAQMTGRAQLIRANGVTFAAQPGDRVSATLERWADLFFQGSRPDGWLENAADEYADSRWGE